MGVLKRKSWLAHVGVALALVVLSGARAGAVVGQISGTATDRAGTLILFPKVIADGTRDTMIQITNTMNTERQAHCIYVNGAGVCSTSFALCAPPPARESGCPVPGETCDPAWQELNFDISLTRQQPTIWRVSTGRTVNPADDENGNCTETIVGGIPRQSCPGIDPGFDVPPPAQPFRGELKCHETDSNGGAPMAGNAFKGEAILETLGSQPPQVSEYNSINIEADSAAVGQNTADLALKLNGAEYNVCPDEIEFSNYAHLAQDPIAAAAPGGLCDSGGLCSGGSNPGDPCTLPGGAECLGGTCIGCPVRTEITFIPCTQNFELGIPIPTTVQIRSIDELETSQSTAFTLDCWANLSLDDLSSSIFNEFNRGDYLKTRVFAASGRRCLAGSRVNLAGSPCDAINDPTACGGDPQNCQGGTCAVPTCTAAADCGAGGVCGPQPGVLAIIEEFHEWDGSLAGAAAAGTAASNGHMIGQRAGLCRNNLATSCTSAADCGDAGTCRLSGAACSSDSQCTGGGGGGEPDRCDVCMVDEVIIPQLSPPPPAP
jgi:hypothetical protein